MSNIVTVISPIDASQYVEIASGERSSIAFLLARLGRDHLTSLAVVDGEQEISACRFVALMYGTGQVCMKTTVRPA